jgi:DNA-binding PadR family transcriptional regulator
MARGEYLGEFEQVVLLAVARLEGQAYGMSIRREIEARGGRHVSIGAVYATLERLGDKGYLRVREGARAGSDGRARRFFGLTRSGIEALTAANELQARMWAGLRLARSRRS